MFDGIPTCPAATGGGRPGSARTRPGSALTFRTAKLLFGQTGAKKIDELAQELFADGRIPDVPATVDAEPLPDEPISDPQQRAPHRERDG